MQAGQDTNNSPPKHEPSGNSDPAESEVSVDTWEESGSEVTGSAVSGSSGWTENSAPADRTSRRALILQMARARMKNNKDSPSKQKLGPTIASEDGSKTVAMDGSTAEFDLTGDLD
jgi:hypothetical protein